LTSEKCEAVFPPEFIEDLKFWVQNDSKTALRVLKLKEAILRDPSEDIGKPEPLKYMAPDTLSRWITQEHCLVYWVGPSQIDFLRLDTIIKITH